MPRHPSKLEKKNYILLRPNAHRDGGNSTSIMSSSPRSHRLLLSFRFSGLSFFLIPMLYLLAFDNSTHINRFGKPSFPLPSLEVQRQNSQKTQWKNMTMKQMLQTKFVAIGEKEGREIEVGVPKFYCEGKERACFLCTKFGEAQDTVGGKSGVTPNLVTFFSDTLEANELLKIKIHRSCPGELDDVVKQLEEATSSVTVGQIGRTLIIYRPSLSKLKAEEKKKQVRKLFLEKQRRRLKLVNMSKEQVPSRRGSSWKARGRASRS